MIKERKEFRKEREKHFEHADHSLTAAVYGQRSTIRWKSMPKVDMRTDITT